MVYNQNFINTLSHQVNTVVEQAFEDNVIWTMLIQLRRYLNTHTDHFIHEIINFENSPYDRMEDYDRNVRFIRQPRSHFLQNPIVR